MYDSYKFLLAIFAILSVVENIYLERTVQFIEPPFSPKQEVPAGTSFPVQLIYSPDTDSNLIFTVKLDCGSVYTTTNDITGNTEAQPFNVPGDYFGTDCVLSIINPPDGYEAEGSRLLAVTQVLTVKQPEPNEVFAVNTNLGFLIETILGTDYNILVTVTCPGITSPQITVPSNRLTGVNFNPDYYGECEVTFEPEDQFFVTPSPFNIYFKYSLIYIGGLSEIVPAAIPIPLKIYSPYQPGPLAPTTIDIQLICQNAPIYTWNGLNINQDITITIPDSEVGQVDCVLSPVENNYYRGDSVKFSVVAVPSFTSPEQDSIVPYGTVVTIVMDNISPNTVVTVTQDCGAQKISDNLDVTGIVTFNLPPDYVGPCYYTAVTNPPLQVEITPLTIFAQGTVSIVKPAANDQFDAGSTMPIQLSYEPRTIPNPEFMVNFKCPDYTGVDINVAISGAAVDQPFVIPDNAHGYCVISVESTPEYASLNTVQVRIKQEITIVLPLPFSTQVVNITVPILVTIDAIFVDPPTYSVEVKCSDNQRELVRNLVMNRLEEVILDPTLVGTCSLQIEFDIVYPPVPFTLKYLLKFKYSPPLIAVNVPFSVFLKPDSNPVSPAPNTIDLELICDSDIIQTWNIELDKDQTVTLTTNPVNKKNCFLATPANDPYNYKVQTPVKMFISPFSGNIYPMTPEEQSEFAKSIAIVSSMFVN